jgi:hypothetical protein
MALMYRISPYVPVVATPPIAFENLWLMTFFPTAGAIIATDSPFSSSPALAMYRSSTAGSFIRDIPEYVTNAMVVVRYEWAGTVPLTWTNRMASNTHTAANPNFFGATADKEQFTLLPQSITNVTYNLTWPDTAGVPSYKTLQIDTSGIGAPTNTSVNVYITGIKVLYSGNFNGVNW